MIYRAFYDPIQSSQIAAQDDGIFFSPQSRDQQADSSREFMPYFHNISPPCPMEVLGLSLPAASDGGESADKGWLLYLAAKSQELWLGAGNFATCSAPRPPSRLSTPDEHKTVIQSVNPSG